MDNKNDIRMVSPKSLKRITKFGWIIIAVCSAITVICAVFITVWLIQLGNQTDEKYNREVKHIVVFINDWYSDVGGESLPDVWQNNVDIRYKGKTYSLTTSGNSLRAEYPDGSVKYCKLRYSTLFFDGEAADGKSIPCLITGEDGIVFKYKAYYKEK